MTQPLTYLIRDYHVHQARERRRPFIRACQDAKAEYRRAFHRRLGLLAEGRATQALTLDGARPQPYLVYESAASVRVAHQKWTSAATQLLGWDLTLLFIRGRAAPPPPPPDLWWRRRLRSRALTQVGQNLYQLLNGRSYGSDYRIQDQVLAWAGEPPQSGVARTLPVMVRYRGELPQERF